MEQHLRAIVRGRIGLLAMLGLASLAALAAASPAFAVSQAFREEFQTFADCPVATAQICSYSTTTAGEFKMGSKSVPINKTVVLQGGIQLSLEPQPLQAAADGNTLSRTPLEVPGGLTGIPGLGGEVTATAEIAGPASSVILDAGNLYRSSGTAITLPLKVKLDNPALGEECYIGSDAEPIVLHLTTGTTDPPPPAQPISGRLGFPTGRAFKGKHKPGLISVYKQLTLVDNSYSVPGVNGCGGSLAPVMDVLVDASAGLPSAAGNNSAVMSGALELTQSADVVKYLKLNKKKK
jgi:hypothetical protein